MGGGKTLLKRNQGTNVGPADCFTFFPNFFQLLLFLESAVPMAELWLVTADAPLVLLLFLLTPNCWCRGKIPPLQPPVTTLVYWLICGAQGGTAPQRTRPEHKPSRKDEECDLWEPELYVLSAHTLLDLVTWASWFGQTDSRIHMNGFVEVCELL